MPSAQTVMLAIHCKRTENVELKAPILQYIREAYSDRDADDAADDLAAVQTLRNELVLAQSGSQGMHRDSLAKYFRALTAIEARFPISAERGHVRLSFPWADAFRPSKKTAQTNVHFEKAAVLFNFGAVLSQQALQVERGTGEGITQACRLFQEAAGAFSLLRETEAAKIDAGSGGRPVDLSPECCSMLERLALAQAQECVFHKAALDRKSPGTQARLAKQAAAMYGEVAALFAAPALASHFERSWAVSFFCFFVVVVAGGRGRGGREDGRPRYNKRKKNADRHTDGGGQQHVNERGRRALSLSPTATHVISLKKQPMPPPHKPKKKQKNDTHHSRTRR